MDQISENLYKVKSLKRPIAQNLPCQVGLNVYFAAKLHMLKFYYLFLKKYVADKDFVLSLCVGVGILSQARLFKWDLVSCL